MGLLLRLLPLCVIAVALWRIVPALGEGASALGGRQAITSINAASLANSLSGINSVDIANSITGELGAATAKRAEPAYVGRKRLDGWDRPYQVRENGGAIEVVSCGEDGRCGTNDDIIEVVRADGSRERIDASFKSPTKLQPAKQTKKPAKAKASSRPPTPASP